MKKFRVAPHTAKRIKAVIAAAMAITLAVPATSYLSSKVTALSVDAEGTVEVPAPIMSVDFETGFMGEASKSGLQVVKSEEVIKFEELKDEKGNYKYDENGHQIFGVTDKPFIEAAMYKKGVVGNQPTTAYDSKMGNVLSLDDTVVIPEYVKKYSDSLDDKYPIGTKLQEEVVAESQIKLNNPFAGLDLSEEYNEETGWTKGVSISYWVKAAVKKDENGQPVKDENDNVVGENSSLINFNNSSIVTMHKDDYMKYQACQNYNESDADYSMGTQEIMTDAEGNSYVVYKNYGKLIRFNPNYPVATVGDVAPSVPGGWYIPKEASKVKKTVKDANGNEFGICSLAGETVEDKGLYNTFNYRYSATDDLANGFSSKSKIREEAIKGSMSITAGDDFVFRADNYDTETLEDNSVVATQGTKVTNPNSAEFEKEFSQFDVYNQFFFNGDNRALRVKETEDENGEIVYGTDIEWHYVTTVIKNDAVYFYVDGEYIDPLEEYKYMGGTANEGDLQMYNAGKAFNQGRGIGYEDGIFAYPESNVSDWSEDGTANESPANSCSITMLDWLSNAGTELFIGGKGYAAGCQSIDLDYDTVDGTMIDDIDFYAVPLDEEQAKEIYARALAKKESVPAPLELEKFTFDDGTMNGTNGTAMENVATNGDNPEVVQDATRGNVLEIKNNKASNTSAIKLSQNPFAGKNLEGATVSFWVKEPAQGAKKQVAQSVALSFVDTKKVLDYDKMGTSVKGKEAFSMLYLTTACDGFFYEGASNGAYQSLGNNFLFSTKRNGNIKEGENSFEPESKVEYDKYVERLQTMSSWHMVTMVMKNSGLYMYLDGEELPNNMYDKGTNAPNFFGLRFYDGYYGRIYDGYKAYKNNCGSNNQGALPLLTFLTDPTTSAYVGYANKLSSETAFERTYTSYFDDIHYYATAMSAEQIKELYNAEKKADVDEPGSQTPDSDNSSSVVEKPNVTVEGSVIRLQSSFAGIEADVSVIPADKAEGISFAKLGTTDDAALYATMNDVIAKNDSFVAKQMQLYKISSDDASFAPNGKFKLTLQIPEGYDSKNVVVVGEDGTVYEGTVSEDGRSITIETSKLGVYAVVEKDMSNEDGSKVAEASKTKTKPGDTANMALPMALIAIAGAAVVVTNKRRKVEED